MTLRNCLIRFGVVAALACGAAIAQTALSPIGTWRSAGIILPGAPGVASVELTVSRVEPDQRASGRFVVYASGMSGTGSYGCDNGSVSGTFDGTTLKVASRETNLCPERVFDLKLEGGQLAGQYKGATGRSIDLAFMRHR
ncbi:MAG: hypothetical protein HY854_09190 [Burkholderiales bacterium]|nr:hypothetical protein [Burkholderiales bacterium]